MEIDDCFQMIEQRLQDGRRYLTGDRLGAADIAFAALTAPALFPEGYAGPLPTIDARCLTRCAQVLRLRDDGRSVRRAALSRGPRHAGPGGSHRPRRHRRVFRESGQCDHREPARPAVRLRAAPAVPPCARVWQDGRRRAARGRARRPHERSGVHDFPDQQGADGPRRTRHSSSAGIGRRATIVRPASCTGRCGPPTSRQSARSWRGSARLDRIRGQRRAHRYRERADARRAHVASSPSSSALRAPMSK